MAIVKLTDTWSIQDYATVFEASKVGGDKLSPPLAGLTHFAFPGVSWHIKLYPRGDSRAKPEHASIYVVAEFGPEKQSISSVWAERSLTILAEDPKDNSSVTLSRMEYLRGGCIWGRSDAFLHEAVKTAVRTKGHLEMKLDLTVFKIVDLLDCRETVRALLSNNQHADVTVNVQGKTLKAHKAILAKRCTDFNEAVPVGDGITADAYSAFLGAVYCDQFDFLTNWELALGVLEISGNCLAEDLRQYCDHSLAEMVPTLRLEDLLLVLPVAVSSNAQLIKSAIMSRLAQQKDLRMLPLWASFKHAASKEILAELLDAFHDKYLNGDSVESTAVYHSAEIKLAHTWTIASADLLQAVVPRPTFVTSPALLEHKAFPALKWQLEFYPHGNSQDLNYTQGFASLYLKANFGHGDRDLKAVHAIWKATITTQDGTQVSTPVSQEYTLYTGAKEMKFGYANAFPLEQYNEALISKTADPREFAVDIRLDLTIANIPEILKCHTLISSLHSDKTYADVEIDVSGVIFKAHKFILAIRSTTFSAMFETNMQEATSGKVEVKDTTPEAFKAFLAAVYYADWDFLSDMDATIDVLNLAEKYDVADLKRYCDEALGHFAKALNVFTILPHAVMQHAEAATAACVEILFTNSEQLMKSEAWKEFEKSVSKEIALDVIKAMSQRGHRLSLKRKCEDDD